MERLAFKMYLNEGQKEEYRKRHNELWPELRQLLKGAGVSEYSIFLDEETSTPVCFSESKWRRWLARPWTNRNRKEMVGFHGRHYEDKPRQFSGINSAGRSILYGVTNQEKVIGHSESFPLTDDSFLIAFFEYKT